MPTALIDRNRDIGRIYRAVGDELADLLRGITDEADLEVASR